GRMLPSATSVTTSSCAVCGCANREATTSPKPSSPCVPARPSSRARAPPTTSKRRGGARGPPPDSDVVVHLEPPRDGLDLRDRALAAALAEPLVRDVHDIAIYKHAGRESVSLHLKMEPGAPLTDAHEAAERVEAALRAQPGVEDVHTHLEPLEQPLLARDETSGADDSQRKRIT